MGGVKLIPFCAARLRRPLISFLGLFFDRQYLSGKYFDNGLQGIKWAFRALWARNILRLAPPRPWPVGLTCKISNCANIDFHPDDLNNFQSHGVYFQNYRGKIVLGRGCYIAPNVGLITANHDLYNLQEHVNSADIVVGERSWIGMNSVILPGVVLGPRTVVAAGAVVTKSFVEGNVLVGGVPARVIRELREHD